MNKKIRLVLVVLLVLITSFGVRPIEIHASTLNAPASKNIEIGKSAVISISTQPNYGIEVSVIVSDPSIVSISKNGSDDSFNGSSIISIVPNSSFVVNGLKLGKSVITLKGFVVSGDEVEVLKTITINVVEPPKKEVANPAPIPPKLDNTEAGNKPSKTPAQIEEERVKAEKEKLKAEEEKLKAEEAAKEELKKVPLISEIEVISNSYKFNGEVLETIPTAKDFFDYEYTLPRRIDDFVLKINAPEGVALTYEEAYKFEAEENEKTIVVNAKKGDIDQTFNVVVKRNVFESVEKNVFDVSFAVYDDERLDSFIESIGAEKIDGTHYKFDDLLFQLVVDTDNKAKWLLLNEDLSDQAFGVIHLNAEGELLFILESEALANETLYGEKYSNKESVIDERISSIDPSLTFETSYKGITFEDGVIVYAMNSKGIKGNHFISNDGSFAYAAVAFDQVNMTYKYVAWGSSIALIALVGALVLTKILNRNKSL